MTDNDGLIDEEQLIDLSEWRPKVKKNGKLIECSEFRATLNDRLRLCFSFKYANTSFNDVFEQNTKYELGFCDESHHPLIATKITLNSEHTEVHCVLTKEPLSINFGKEIARASGKIFNLNPGIFIFPVKLETDRASISLIQAKDASNIFRSALRKKTTFAEVGLFEVLPKSSTYLAGDLQRDLANIWDFFRFVSGSHIGFGPWSALDATNVLNAIQPDVGRHDVLFSNSSWSSFPCHKEIGEMFNLYQTVCEDPRKASVLNRTFEFYRMSTAARHFAGIEAGIMLAQSALELLCDFILGEYAGWTVDLKNRTHSFHHKLRASAASIGFKGELLEHSPALQEAFKKQNRQTIDDFNAITMARNDITHAKQEVALGGIELLQVWNSMMFMNELLVMYLLGYNGMMADRRRMSGWFGETIEVPIRLAV